MKIFKKANVFDEALERIRFIFDEFENVIVNHSGGKDSVIVYNLALQVAREKGRLPLKVMFIDQEAEFNQTIEVIRKVMYHPEVEPLWLQVPIKLFNATSFEHSWLECWSDSDEEEWLRPKDPISIKENTFGTDRFAKLFIGYADTVYRGRDLAYIAGVRCEESPARFKGLTTYPTYKWVTWGKKLSQEKHKTFYPIYDWSYTDVWAAIHRNGWDYNKIYDIQYQHGVKIQNMRVSNLHHETAVHALFYLQEVDVELYNRLTKRLQGVSSATKFNDDFFVHKLPYMFRDWQEYRDYLLDKLVTDPEAKASFRKIFGQHEAYPLFGKDQDMTVKVLKGHVNAILANDWTGTKLANLRNMFSGPNNRKRQPTKEKRRS